MTQEKEVQDRLDQSLIQTIPTGEATELPPDSAWQQWDWAVRMQDFEETFK